jgi:hypothetical protein
LSDDPRAGSRSQKQHLRFTSSRRSEPAKPKIVVAGELYLWLWVSVFSVLGGSRPHDRTQDPIGHLSISLRDVQSRPRVFHEIGAEGGAPLARYGCGQLHGIGIGVAEVAINMGAAGDGYDA